GGGGGGGGAGSLGPAHEGIQGDEQNTPRLMFITLCIRAGILPRGLQKYTAQCMSKVFFVYTIIHPTTQITCTPAHDPTAPCPIHNPFHLQQQVVPKPLCFFLQNRVGHHPSQPQLDNCHGGTQAVLPVLSTGHQLPKRFNPDPDLMARHD
ncbi:unnamed protein product, partial [Discosporangium mesarthrocarpum]